MNSQELIKLLSYSSDNAGIVIVILIGMFITAVTTAQQLGFYANYLLVLLLVIFGAIIEESRLYSFAFALGIFTAFTEIIGKFSDEPIKSLGTSHALLYHLLNGAIAAFTLRVLILNGAPSQQPLDQMKIVFTAGLGSMLVMRSKLFNLKVGGEDISFGPEQIIKVFFRFMEGAIDRVRAQSRIQFIKEKLNNIDFEMVYDYSLTMLEAAQALEEKTRKELETEIKNLKTNDPADKQLKSYRLGFLLLNRMGEDFVSKLYEKIPPEWQLRAPIPEMKEEGLTSRIPFFSRREETVLYMAYGANLSTKTLRDRLGWTELTSNTFQNATSPKKCVLSGYQLVFNKPSSLDPERIGFANVVKNEKTSVEGVLYQLTKTAVDFLDRSEDGYRRESLTVKVGNDTKTAHVYIAAVTRDDLRPTKEHLNTIMEGAREHQLSSEYIEQLKKYETDLHDDEPELDTTASNPEVAP